MAKQKKGKNLKAAFMTLGCKVNQFETETLEGLFKQRGYTIVPFDELADVYVINTCSVTSLGDRKSRQIIRRAHRHNPEAAIAVCGCYAQVAPDDISKLEGVSVILGTKDRAKIVDLVEKATIEHTQSVHITDVMHNHHFEDIPIYDSPERTRAFLKIEDGCENFCSYCIIPYARGAVKSRELKTIKTEIEKLVSMGFKEIVLTGIHLGAYGRDFKDGTTLVDACRTALSVPGLKRLRLGSLESIELTSELFSLLREEKRFCNHLHIPLQAGSDSVLRAMNRHYTTKEFANLIKNVEQEVPGIAISTDLIVGFPGESDEDFEQGMKFIKKMNFSRLHIFPYSPREGTPAAKRKDQIPEQEKKYRVQRMQKLANEISSSYESQFFNQTLEVLFETTQNGISDGLTQNYIRVYTDSPITTGELFSVQVIKLYKDGLWGKVIK